MSGSALERSVSVSVSVSVPVPVPVPVPVGSSIPAIPSPPSLSPSTRPSTSSSVSPWPSSITTSSWWPSVRHFIGGYASGMALVLVGHPFDTLKVRIQTEGKSGRFKGPAHCARETLRSEGIRGLYKGVTPPLFATGVINSILFGLQGATIRTINREWYHHPTRTATVLDTSIAAMITGFLISFIVTPMEGIKSRLQVQYATGTSAYTGPIDCFRHVYTKSGLRGIYRGWSSVVFCRMSNWSYFGAYAGFKQLLSTPSSSSSSSSAPPTLSLPANILAGGCAGICYWLSCYPMDVIKSRIMVHPDTSPSPSIRQVARTIYARDGWKGFAAGFTPCIIRAFPANAATFCVFELVMRILPA